MYKIFLAATNFKIAWRNLGRSKVYSFINIAGLAIGLACAMLIILYVKDEASFDRFHDGVNRIYRIVNKSQFTGKETSDGSTGFLQGPEFARNVPGIESFVRVESGTADIKDGSEIRSQDLLYVDSNFFKVFTFPLSEGDPGTCLKNPRSIVLSEGAAMKQFGTRDAVGKTVMLKDDSTFVPYQVTAVARKCPQNSSIQFDMLLPFRESAKEAANNENWFSFFLNTFVVVAPGANIATISDQMQSYYVKNASQTFQKLVTQFGLDPNQKINTYFLQPFTDMHLNPELPAENGLVNASKPIYSYILSGIALFILLIACINFINLTIARSARRAREIGIRKVIGSNRRQLVIQFLGESLFLCFIAFALALAIVVSVLPVFNTLANKALSIAYLSDGELIAGYGLLFVATSFIAGFYPALVLSAYQPAATLYGRFKLGNKNFLQKSLVVFQFALASFLIAGTFLIYHQFHFLTHTPLGYNDHDVIELRKDNLSHLQAASFKNDLLQNPDILYVAPKNAGQWRTIAKINNDSSIQFQYETVDASYLAAMQIPVVRGRNFSDKYSSDSIRSVIVNESFVKEAGWKDPIGQSVNLLTMKKIYQVIGVIKDYHFLPLNQKIGPQLFTMENSNTYGLFNIKIKSGTETSSLKFINEKFKEFFPLAPYSYVFKNDQNQKQYESEAKWKQIILLGAILTIFISCIGLFGLSVLATERRKKEIGIRKVLGAGVADIVSILSKDFLKLVCMALIISLPLVWYAANEWLKNYPYRITVSWSIFALAGILVILIALFTVSFQSIKAAAANPADSLKAQ